MINLVDQEYIRFQPLYLSAQTSKESGSLNQPLAKAIRDRIESKMTGKYTVLVFEQGQIVGYENVLGEEEPCLANQMVLIYDEKVFVYIVRVQ